MIWRQSSHSDRSRRRPTWPARDRSRGAAALIWLALAMMGLAVPAGAEREYAEVPKAGADHSAYRIEAEIFGWNKNFTEVGALGSEIVRGPGGKQRGELFLLVYRVGETTPIHNVHVLFITQADQPQDPMPIDDVRSKMWALGHRFLLMWPERPVHERPHNGMFIDLVFDPVEVEPGLCQPYVGFMLTYRGALRYQPHQPLPLQVACDLLKHTDTRTYWAKADLAAAMVRFDYSPNKANEKSTRLPVSASWNAAKVPHVLLRTAWPLRNKRTKDLVDTLHGYGNVRVEHRPGLRSNGQQVARTHEYRFIARRLIDDLEATLSDDALPSGIDMLVVDGKPPAAQTPSTERDAKPNAANKPPQAGEAPPNEVSGSYINNWTVE